MDPGPKPSRFSAALSGRLASACLTAIRRIGFLALATVAAIAPPAMARDSIRICVDDRPHPPFLLPDREGSVQALVRMAAAQAGLPIEVMPMPVRRCKAAIQRQAADAMLMAGYVASNAQIMVFPVREGRVETEKAVAQSFARVFRRKGAGASWDGARFINLDGPILVPTGYAFITDRLVQAQVPFDEGARYADQNFHKLASGRADLVILPENDGLELLRDPKWSSVIEALPAPFLSQDFFLAFSIDYFRQRPEVAEAFWRAIADARNSREYRLLHRAGP